MNCKHLSCPSRTNSSKWDPRMLSKWHSTTATPDYVGFSELNIRILLGLSIKTVGHAKMRSWDRESQWLSGTHCGGDIVQGQTRFRHSRAHTPWQIDRHTCIYKHMHVRTHTVYPPMWVLLQSFDGLLDVADIPEFNLAVVSAAGQVILPVWVEVQVAHQLAMSVIDTVNLTERREKERQIWGRRLKKKSDFGQSDIWR